MSTLKVDTITKADGTGSMSVPAETGSLVTTEAGSVESAMTTQFGRRNLIINGAMQVAQRGTSFADPSQNSYTLDRWSQYENYTTWTISQDSESPSGFTSSLKVNVTSGGSIASGTIGLIGQALEGYTVTGLGWDGTSDAKPLTVSFWVRSSKAGKYSVRVRIGGAGTCIKSFSISSANTWEHITVTFPASPYAISNTTTGTAFFFGIGLAAGGNYLASDGVWQTSDDYGLADQVSWGTDTGDTFYITGFQLEVGSVATPFEHRSYGEELALCQRYYTNAWSNSGYYYPGYVFNNNTLSTQAFKLPVTMRVSPTLTATTPSHITTSGNWGIYGATNGWSSTGYTPNFSTVTTELVIVQFASVSGVTNHYTYICGGGFTADAEL